MTAIKRFEDIEAWQLARKLTKEIYQISGMDSFGRDYALRDQIRRASVSVLSNIAEGFESRTQALFIEFLGRAKGSAGEVRAQLYVALDCGYLQPNEFERLKSLAEEVSRKVYWLIRYLESQPNRSRIGEEGAIYEITS